MKVFRFEAQTLIPAPLERVFEFFSRAENLERITPKSLRFEILSPMPIVMKPGALIEYRLRLSGIPFRWVTKITAWEPNRRFVDEQLKGPYRQWIHEHTFESDGSRTRMRDVVDYAVPGGPLAPIINALFVKRQVQKIFAHRGDEIRRQFPGN